MMSANNRKYFLSLLFLFALSIFAPSASEAFESNINIITGYNDNIDRLQEPQGSSFITTYIDLSHQSLYMKGFGESLFYFNASYNQPDETESKTDACIGGHYSFFPFKSPLMVLGFAESGIFRNEETPADDYNWVSSGGRLKYHYSGRITIDFLQKLRWRTFSEPLFYYTTVSNPAGTGNDTEIIISEDQKDVLMISDGGFRIDLYPWLHVSINGFFRHMFSSIDKDVYNESGSRCSIKVSLNRAWYVILNAGIADKSFNNSIRADTINTAGGVISRAAEGHEVFLGLNYTENNSSYIEESYRQKVIQCGLSLFF